MWYEILIEKEFVDYLTNDDNVFWYDCESGKKLAPKFNDYKDIVIGVTRAWNHPNLDAKELCYEECYKYMLLGFEHCKKYLSLSSYKNIFDIWHSISKQFGKPQYQVDIEQLSKEQCAVLIMYQFWSRMGVNTLFGFQQSGWLKKYLLALKNKCEDKPHTKSSNL
jgi:hypothetical protein